VVATLIGPGDGFAYKAPGPCTYRQTMRLRDGALFTRRHLEVPLYSTAWKDSRPAVTGGEDGT